jgi:hypothetical protein
MKFVPGGLRPTRTAFRRLALALGASAILAVTASAQTGSSQTGSSQTGSANAPADDSFHYNNLWEISGGLAYAGMPNGPNIQHRASLAGADVAATQWIYPRLGATADLRTYAGLGNTNANPYTVNSPLFVETYGSVGPEFRWIRTPAIGVTLHALAGGGYGIFDIHVPSGVNYQGLGTYPNGSTFDLIGGANFDFNTPSGFGVRISPNVITTDFHGDLRNSFTITAGLVWRYGKF